VIAGADFYPPSSPPPPPEKTPVGAARGTSARGTLL